MPNTLDDANKAVEEMFEQNNQEVLDDVNTAETENSGSVADETDNLNNSVPDETESNTQEQTALGQAAETAEVAAQVAADKEAQLQEALREIEILKQQNSQMQGSIDELSRHNEQQLVEDILEPPTLDINSLAFADEETIKAAQAKYAADMAEYNRKQIMKELSPFVEQAKEGIYEKEKREIVSALSQVPELNGIESMMPQLEKIIKNNKALSSDDIPLDEKLITAYAIAKGVNSINTPPVEPKEPTTEELMALYNNNADFRDMVEKQRLEQIKQSQQVPPFSASSGAVNAALNIEKEPKTLEEASAGVRKLFKL